ncbi:MAG: ABC transporter ATP-binding protein, partial [Chloroflexi bacterium]|nr:ABC transporter ATP-binding protein [Chloroflexota bacterium]
MDRSREAGAAEGPVEGAALHLDALTIGYAGHGPPRVVAAGLRATVQPGTLTCLLGPNGVGKSTLLRTVAGLLPPLAGHASMQGQAIHALSARDRARRLSVVLTDAVTVPLLSAYELVALGRHPHTDRAGRLSAEDHRVVDQALEAVSAQDLADRIVTELSDGERQRVMVARALAQQ